MEAAAWVDMHDIIAAASRILTITEPLGDDLVDESQQRDDRTGVLRCDVPAFYSLEEFVPSVQDDDGDDLLALTPAQGVQICASIGHVMSNWNFVRVVERREGRASHLYFVARPTMLLDLFRGVFSFQTLRSLCALIRPAEFARRCADPTRWSTANLLAIASLLRSKARTQTWRGAPLGFTVAAGVLALLEVEVPVFEHDDAYRGAFAARSLPAPAAAFALIDRWCELRRRGARGELHVHFEGFSLGGIVSTVLGALVLAREESRGRDRPRRFQVHLTTLCSMRLGDDALAEFVGRRARVINVVSEGDPVSRWHGDDAAGAWRPLRPVHKLDLTPERPPGAPAYEGEAAAAAPPAARAEGAGVLGVALRHLLDLLLDLLCRRPGAARGPFHRFHLVVERLIPLVLAERLRAERRLDTALVDIKPGALGMMAASAVENGLRL